MTPELKPGWKGNAASNCKPTAADIVEGKGNVKEI